MSGDWIDAHCHLADPRWVNELNAVLDRSRAAGVGRWLQGGVDPQDWKRQRELVARHPEEIWPSFGLHPWWVRELSRSDSDIKAGLAELEAAILRGEARALGETGLDFSGDPALWEGAAKTRQVAAFEAQLRLGRAHRLPIVLHVVRAHGVALAILEAGGRLAAGGLVHSFSGSFESARRYIELGLLISVGASVVRRKGFETLKRAVVRIPPDALVLESDAPDQPPEGWTERTGSPWNEPASLREVAEAVGKLRGEPPEAVLDRSARNIERVFGNSEKGFEE